MKNRITIDKERCKGCSLCIPVCPKNVIGLSEDFNAKGWRYACVEKESDCTACKQCYMMCPDVAIRIWKED